MTQRTWGKINESLDELDDLLSFDEEVDSTPIATADDIWNLIQYFKIIDRNQRLVSFKPFPTQEKLIERILEKWQNNEKIRLIILKSRRLGTSAAIAAVIAAIEFLVPNRFGLVVSHEVESALEIFDMYQNYFSELPPSLKKPLKYNNMRRLQFADPHRSRVRVATADRKELGRSSGFADLHCSEAAFWPKWSTVVALSQTVPKVPRTFIAWESTANSINEFFDRWQAVNDPKHITDYEPIFLDWRDFPYYSIPLVSREKLQFTPTERDYVRRAKLTDAQAKWYLFQKNDECQGDQTLFDQEYPYCPERAFRASGTPFFDQDTLIRWSQETVKDPLWKGELKWISPNEPIVQFTTKGDSHRLLVWERPLPGYWYVIGGDTGLGVMADFTVLNVIKIPREATGKPEQVAMFRSNLRVHDPAACGVIAYQLGLWYNNALIGIERDNPGLTCISTLLLGRRDAPQIQEAYPNLYYYHRPASQAGIDAYQTMIPGWPSNVSTRRPMLHDLQSIVNNDWLILRDRTHLNELRGFGWDAEKSDFVATHTDPETRKKHDDCIMSLGIAMKMVEAFRSMIYFRKPMEEI